MVAVGGILVLHGVRNAQVEERLTSAGLPRPGTLMPTVRIPDQPVEMLLQSQSALEEVLRLRPDWGEGHLRLGLIRLALYQHLAREWIGDAAEPAAADDGILVAASDPRWLLGLVQVVEEQGDEALEELKLALADQEPIRRHLIPAARSFLEARRCVPAAAQAHGMLASLHFLLSQEPSAATHIERALQQAGNDGPTITSTAYLAVLTDELDLAAQGWRQQLEVDDRRWATVADIAAALLPPEQILSEVVPDGQNTLRFAERLYKAPEDAEIRERFLRTAIERLPYDHSLPSSQRFRLEAVAWAALDQPDQAKLRMEGALALEPLNTAWRQELIAWLLEWGRFEEAHQQALIGLHYAPEDSDAIKALESAAEALARGENDPAP